MPNPGAVVGDFDEETLRVWAGHIAKIQRLQGERRGRAVKDPEPPEVQEVRHEFGSGDHGEGVLTRRTPGMPSLSR